MRSPKPLRIMVGNEHEMIGVLGFGEVDGAEERVGREEHIGIGEEQPGRGGLTGSKGHGMELAQPARRKIDDMNDGEAG